MSDDHSEPMPRKRSGPSMREQIAARRRAEQGGRAEQGDAEPAPKRASNKGGKSARKAAPKAKAAAAPAASKAAAKAESTRPARPSSRSSARRAGAGRSRRGDDDEEEGEERPRGRRERAPKKKSPLPMIAAGVLVLGGGAGAYFAMSGGGNSEASETDPKAGDTDTAGTDTTDTGANEQAPADAPAEGGADAVPEPAADTPAADATPAADDPTVNSAAGIGAGEAADTEDAGTEPETPKAAPAAGNADYAARITERRAQIAEMTPFAKPEGVTDEAWTKLQADAALVIKGGGRSVKLAETRLAEAGKAAFPAGLNAMIAMNFDDPGSFANAKHLTDAINRARGSENDFGYGWRPSDRHELPSQEDISWNLGRFMLIHGSWTKCLEDPDYWNETVSKAAQYEKTREIEGKAAEEKLEGGLSNDDFDDGE